jgi:hypothetical protein
MSSEGEVVSRTSEKTRKALDPISAHERVNDIIRTELTTWTLESLVGFVESGGDVYTQRKRGAWDASYNIACQIIMEYNNSNEK